MSGGTAAALIGLACAATPVLAHAQEKPGDYPKKPIRIVVGIAPAGGLDLMTRLGAQKLALDGNEVVAPVTPEELNAKLGREYAEMEKVIRTLNLRIN